MPWKLYKWRAYWGKKCKDTPPYFFLGLNLKSLFFPRFHVFRISRFLVDRMLSLWLGSRAWGEAACEKERPSVVVVDHAFVTYWIDSFIRGIRSAGIPTIALPHSSFMFTHTHVLENEKGVPLKKTNEDEFPWNCIVVESGMRIVLLKELGIPAERMLPLGCIRFTKWWLNRSPHEGQRRQFPRKDQRPTVLYLASNPGVTVKAGVERLRESMVKYRDRLRFVVKVHSRRDRTELFKSFADSGIDVVGNEWSSPELINAADYIVVTVTSVIIDAMLKDKPIVYAQFTTENEPLFARYGVFPAARTAEELEGIFDRMADREWVPEPREEARRSYLKECVYGGFSDEESVIEGCLEIFSRAVRAGSVDGFSRWVKDTGGQSLSRPNGWGLP
jgi:hypothetical protein